MKATKLFKEFFDSEKSSGLVLIACTFVSIVLANSDFKSVFLSVFHYNIFDHSIEHWINDGLMTIFFLLVGLELERELYKGELSNIKDAFLPIFGAIGGMFVPAFIFYLLNFNTSTQSGSGIPMATDIAFALGILSLLGNKVPISLKVFLTALAVIDDLGAIIIIAIFYTKTFVGINLIIALFVFSILLILNRLKVHILFPYILGGIIMWYFMLHSGVHATITGVLLAFAIPFGKGDKTSISYKLQHFLHKPVAFIIMPIFALASTAINFSGDFLHNLSQPYSLGIIFGLLLGKPIGIFLFAFLSTKLNLCKLPDELNWKNIIGVGFLGGIGFTMSIFITSLAYSDAFIINNSKLMILVASLCSGLVGFFVLKRTLK